MRRRKWNEIVVLLIALIECVVWLVTGASQLEPVIEATIILGALLALEER